MTEGSSNDARPTAAIHVDLDGASDIFAAHGWSYRDERDLLFESGLSNTLKFLDEAGIRATLFVIAKDLDDPRKRELLEDAVIRGHEIASHTLSHRRLTTLNREEKRREIFESRERLAETLGVEVRGFRAPNFDIDCESFELISKAGYTYDSSVMPCGRLLRRLGYCEMDEKPYYPLDNNPLWELPIPIYKLISLPFHPCYGLVLGLWYFRLGLRRFRRTGAPLVLLFHLTDLADPLPADRLPGWQARLFTLSYLGGEHKRRCCEQMLKLVRRDYTLVDTISLLAMQSKVQIDNLSIEGS